MGRKTLIFFIIGFILFISIVFIFLILLNSDSDTSVNKLKPGDCLKEFYTTEKEDADGEEIKIELVECTEAHAQEVYSVFVDAFVESTNAPDDAIIETTVTDLCLPDFEKKFDTEYDASSLSITSLYPSAQAWGEGDRRLVCLISNVDRSSLNVQVTPAA